MQLAGNQSLAGEKWSKNSQNRYNRRETKYLQRHHPRAPFVGSAEHGSAWAVCPIRSCCYFTLHKKNYPPLPGFIVFYRVQSDAASPMVGSSMGGATCTCDDRFSKTIRSRYSGLLWALECGLWAAHHPSGRTLAPMKYAFRNSSYF